MTMDKIDTRFKRRHARGSNLGDQSFFVCPFHPLNLVFEQESFPQSRDSGVINKLDGAATARITGAGAAIVRRNALVEVGGLTGIECAVATAQDVDLVGHAA